MRINSWKRPREFAKLHPNASSPLKAWRKEVKQAKWRSFTDLKAKFGNRVDRSKELVIFDIGGKKHRLIAAIHYNGGRLYVRHVLTHAEYDRDKWKGE
jgi:mRNA interferase HigB